MMAPAVPAAFAATSGDAATVATFGESLVAAEKAFSDEAQKIGIGAAFAKHGSRDAVNMGGPKDAGFVVGSEAIGRSVGEGSPTDRSEVAWSADRVLVAPSGDLGITFGVIRILQPTAGAAVKRAILHHLPTRESCAAWRYIAE